MRWMLSLFLMSAIVTGCGGTPVRGTEAADSRCTTIQTDIESVWSSEAQFRLEANVEGAERPVGGANAEVGWSRATYQRITTGMDQASQDWVHIRTANCDDVSHGRLSQPTYEARMGCLDQWLTNTRNAVASEDPAAFDRLITTIGDCMTRSGG